MDLTEEQKARVRQWVSEGEGLSELQRRLGAEFGLKLTYMDVRFLIIDLGLDLQERADAPHHPDAAGEGMAPQSSPPSSAQPASPDSAAVPGAVSVELDRIVRPGSVVSGTVTFSDGVTASWWVDQLGRLGIEASRPGYKPGNEDLLAFQDELKKALSRHGF